MATSVCINVYGMSAWSRCQDGDQHARGLIKHTASVRHLFNQASGRRFDRQAIFQILPQTSGFRQHFLRSAADQFLYAAAGFVTSKVTPYRSAAQAMRASLLARATTTVLRCRLASRLRSHAPSLV